jgi:CheY-like chemotaxis protein
MKKNKILLVEDDIYLRKLYRKKFEISNFSIFEAQNGIEGLKKINLIHPDVLLLDMSMPKMDGIEFLNNLAKSGTSKCLPIIVLSAISEKVIIDKCKKKLNVNFYFVKHKANPNQILSKIKSMIEV